MLAIVLMIKVQLHVGRLNIMLEKSHIGAHLILIKII